MSDRPVHRRAIKLAMTLLHPARAHRQDLWPGMAIDRPTGRVTWRGAPLLDLVPLAAMVPSSPEVIAVVGSGPSLSDQHPERLPPGAAILLNGAAVLATRVDPLAVMVEDERFVFRHMDVLAALAPGVPLMLSPAALRAVAERDAHLLRRHPVALIENIAKPVNAAKRALDDPALDEILCRGDGTALSTDPDRGVVIHGTVALSAVQVALAARPGRIVLAGIDLRNAAEPRFYETAGDMAPSGLVTGLDRILKGFALMQRMAEARGTELRCASPVSALLDLGIARTEMLS